MNKLIVMLVIAAIFTSCKNDSKSSVFVDESQAENSVREISGDFIYFSDAGVLQTRSELFGVVENGKTQELIKMAEPLKIAATDEVAVTLKVKVIKKPEHEEGWEKWIEIIDILKVSKVDQEDSDIIKLSSEN